MKKYCIALITLIFTLLLISACAECQAVSEHSAKDYTEDEIEDTGA